MVAEREGDTLRTMQQATRAALLLMTALSIGCGSPEVEARSVEEAPAGGSERSTVDERGVPSDPVADGCVTPWYLDAARGPDALTCRASDGTEITTECEACAMRDGVCFAERPGEVVERRALDGTHHRFAASHTCVPACCAREDLTPLPVIAPG